MQPFFTVDEIKKIEKSTNACDRCEYKDLHYRMQKRGNYNKKILIIVEDYYGSRVVSAHYRKLIQEAFVDYGLDASNDAYIMSAVGCPKARNTEQQINACRQALMEEVETLKPRVIITLGEMATTAVFGGETKSEYIWSSYKIPQQKDGYNYWVFPTYSLEKTEEFIDGDENKRYAEYQKQISKDICSAIKFYVENEQDNFSVTDYIDLEELKKYCEILNTEQALEFLQALNNLMEPFTITFDYETNCLNSFLPKARIYSCSIYWNGVSYAFLMKQELEEELIKLMQNKNIEKWGANNKFEQLFTKNILGTDVENFTEDCILQASLLFNKRGVSVKVQAMMQLGIDNWSEEIDRYIKSSNKEGYNDIEKAPIDALLLYNALDSIIEHKLCTHFAKHITPVAHYREAYKLLQEGSLMFADMEQVGWRVDIPYYEEQRLHIESKIKVLHKKMEKDPTIKLWKEKWGKEFSLSAPKQIKDVLFGKLGLEPVMLTPSGNPATHKEALSHYNLPFLKMKEKIGKLNSVNNTYINQFINKHIDGVLHPDYSMLIAASYRSSCSNPNLMNIPIRDEMMKKITRRGIYAREGNIIGEHDYSTAEVRVGWCYHKDKNMYDYLENPEADMHIDVSKDCFLLIDEQVHPEVRQDSKGGFTFPEFYGSWYDKCARSLWNLIKEDKLQLNDGTPMYEHLESKGIKNLKQFINHIESVEDILWNKRFPAYRDWKDEIWARYKRDGYLESLTGFVYRGIISKNQATNLPIQGSAFHVLFWDCTEINKELKKRKLQSRVMGQIHDSVLTDIVPDEKAEVDSIIVDTMENKVHERFEWLNIPMRVDGEFTEPNQSWYYKKEEKGKDRRDHDKR